SSRRRHTRFSRDWSSDVCSSDLQYAENAGRRAAVTLVHGDVEFQPGYRTRSTKKINNGRGPVNPQVTDHSREIRTADSAPLRTAGNRFPARPGDQSGRCGKHFAPVSHSRTPRLPGRMWPQSARPRDRHRDVTMRLGRARRPWPVLAAATAGLPVLAAITFRT